MEAKITIRDETYTIVIRYREAMSFEDDWTGYTYEIDGKDIDAHGSGTGLSYGDTIVEAVQRLVEELELDTMK
jgi:hypothetical protein